MNPQSEFMSEAFHTLAQPIAALRATVELGLCDHAGDPAHQVLENCLRLTDRLMQEMAVLREIASLGEAPSLSLCDGQALLQTSVEEMAPVADASGVALHLDAPPALIFCHPPTLQRALFFLLDEMIAHSGSNRTISISLRHGKDGFVLGMSPGSLQGRRGALCRKLMQFAGGSAIDSATGDLSVLFHVGSYRKVPATTLVSKQLLMSH